MHNHLKSTSFIGLFLVILLCACNNGQKNKTDQPVETEQTDSLYNTTESPKEPKIPFRAFEAFGNEPGWSLKAEKSEFHINYNLSLDYGELNFEGEDGEFQSESSQLILYLDNRLVTVQLLKEPCTDMADNLHTYSVEFSYNGQKYVGCGDIND